MVETSKILHYRDAYNVIKEESIENFNDSLFSEQYRRASIIVSEIIEYNLKLLRDNDCDKKEAVLSENKNSEVYNVISFLGGRGTGKTSVMTSYAKFLKNYECYLGDERNNINKRYFLDIRYNESVSFLKLDMIHTTMLGKNEGLLDVILANMWELYSDLEDKKHCKEGFFEEREKIAREFSALKKAYQDYRQSSENNHISEIRQLSELASCLNFRKSFQKFVKSFLNVFCKKSYKFLVITIDDIDIARVNSFLILEQLHLFLNVPNVIIMVTADISRLQQICEHYYYEQYVSGEQFNADKDELPIIINNKQDFARDFLEKVIALDMRIYMPDIYMINPALESEKGNNEDNDVNDIKIDNIKSRILHKLFKNGIEFDAQAHAHHFLEGYTLRENIALLHELGRGDREEENREKEYINTWLLQRIREQLINKVEFNYIREQLNEVFYVDDDYINGYFKQLIDNILDRLKVGESYWREDDIYWRDADIYWRDDGAYWTAGKLYGYRLSEVLCGCNILEQKDYRYQKLVNVIIAYYTVKIAQISEKDSSKKDYGIRNLFKGALWGIWTDTMFKGMRSGMTNYTGQINAPGANLRGFGIKLSIKREDVIEKLLSDIFDKENDEIEKVKLKNDSLIKFILKLIEDNREQIRAYQVLLAFLNIVNYKTDISINFKSSVEPIKSNTSEIMARSDVVQGEAKEINTIIEKKADPTDFAIMIQGDYDNEVLDFNFDYPLMNIADYKRICSVFETRIVGLILDGLYKIILVIMKDRGINKDILIRRDKIVSGCRRYFGDSKFFLKYEIEEWGNKYPKGVVFPYKNVEMIYAIGKKVEREVTVFREDRFYVGLRRIFIFIRNELKTRDEFYNMADSSYGYCKPYEEYPVIKFFLENQHCKEAQDMLEALIIPVQGTKSPVHVLK